MRFGYARVSTTGQSLDVQNAELNRHAVERIVAEKKSGTKMEGRDELRGLLQILRKGDELYITRLDRLARSIRDLIEIARVLEDRGVSLHVVQQAIETKTPAGRLFFHIIAAMAEFETELRKERQLEGITAARASGAYATNHRKPSYDRKEIARLKFDLGMKTAHIAKHLGCAEFTIRRALKEIAAGQPKEAAE